MKTVYTDSSQLSTSIPAA